MPARVNKIRHDENTRLKIRATLILERLQAHFFEEQDPKTKQVVKLDSVQVNLGLALLKKMIPDLSSVEYSGEVSISKVIRSPAPSATPSTWAKDHIPAHLRPTEH